MSSETRSAGEVRIRARNVGGIEETQVTIPPGVTVLSGRNATNRTSFLQALMAGLGSTRPSLKGDAETGEVELSVDEETYTRTLARRGDTVVFDGDPFLDDPEIADLFAFLLEDNETRRAVERGDDLREIIMRPVDNERIEAEIRELESEKDDLDERIAELERLEGALPDLKAEKADLEDDLADAREELAEAEAAIEELDVDLEESRSRKEELEEAFRRVREARSDLEDVEFEIEAEESTRAELRAEREELAESLADADPIEEDPERIEGQIEELRRRKRALDETLSELGSVISFNDEMLEGDGLDVEFEPDGAGDDGALTDELLDDETVCWTCGSEVDSDAIEETLDRLRELRASKLEERNELRSRIDELSGKRSALRERRDERERTERRLDEVKSEIADVEGRIEALEDRREETEKRVDELEAATEDVGTGEYDEVIERHRAANELEFRVEGLESDLAEIDDEIAETEAAIDELGGLRERREVVADELTDRRTRVDRIEADAVEAFNDHMASVLDVLDYDNIERIWIERRETQVHEGRRKVERTRFDLHIVRNGPDGAAYRDTIDHLSESEREVTGVVFALAGYLVHDVHETLPFILLDSLEAIDSDRIAAIVDYLREYADHLVVALLPEDAAALSGDHHTVESI